MIVKKLYNSNFKVILLIIFIKDKAIDSVLIDKIYI